MSKRRRTNPARGIRILVLILFIIMIFTNPSKSDFYEWVNNKALEDSETVVEGALKNIFVSPLLKTLTVRKDYFLFSTYTVEIDDSKLVYVGAFNQFFEYRSDF